MTCTITVDHLLPRSKSCCDGGLWTDCDRSIVLVAQHRVGWWELSFAATTLFAPADQHGGAEIKTSEGTKEEKTTSFAKFFIFIFAIYEKYLFSSLSLSLSLSISLLFSFSISISSSFLCLYLYLLSVCLSVCLSIYLSIYLSILYTTKKQRKFLSSWQITACLRSATLPTNHRVCPQRVDIGCHHVDTLTSID
jgi:hypothetical protein